VVIDIRIRLQLLDSSGFSPLSLLTLNSTRHQALYKKSSLSQVVSKQFIKL